MALLSLAVAAAALCVSESWSLAPCCSSWLDAYWHSPSGPGPPSSSSALQQLDSGGKSKDVRTLWMPKDPRKAMARKRGGKATGRHLNASSGCSSFRGPYSMSTRNSPPHSPVHTTQPPSPQPSDPKDPSAFPGCSGQMGQSPLPLPATHQPPLRPGKVGSIYLVASCRLCGLI